MGKNISGTLCKAAEHKKTAGGMDLQYKKSRNNKKKLAEKTVKLDKHTKLMHLCTSRLT